MVKTTPVPDELLRELKANVLQTKSVWEGSRYHGELAGLVNKLPSPPPLDPVEECERARLNTYSREPMAGDVNRIAMLAALRRYRELGCPEIP